MSVFVRVVVVASIAAALGCNLPEGSATAPTSPSGPGSTSSQGTMSANIGNFPWTANGRVTATYSPAQNGIGASVLTIAGQDFPLTESLTFAVASVNAGAPLSIGTFQIGASGITATLTDSTGTTFQAAGPVGTGTITVDTFSTGTRIATGTFNLILQQTGGIATKAVASGTYSVTF